MGKKGKKKMLRVGILWLIGIGLTFKSIESSWVRYFKYESIIESKTGGGMYVYTKLRIR